jgi:hypothetical protein
MSVTQEFYECPECSMKSYNTHDKENKYCGNCHKFESDRDNKIMPDGRPLYAHKNEKAMNDMLRDTAVNRMAEFTKLFKLFQFTCEHWEDCDTLDGHVYIKINRTLAMDYANNPEKYLEIDAKRNCLKVRDDKFEKCEHCDGRGVIER